MVQIFPTAWSNPVLRFSCPAVQGRSWNVSFLWLQRRVGAQFATLSYMIADNLFHYYDGDKWVTRDWTSMMSRWNTKDRSGPRAGPMARPTFASSAVQQ